MDPITIIAEQTCVNTYLVRVLVPHHSLAPPKSMGMSVMWTEN